MEKTNTKTRIEGKRRITSILVCAGTAVIGLCHQPQEYKRADPVTVSMYTHGQKLYNPQKWWTDWKSSERRKEHLMQHIASIRRQVRVQAEIYQRDRDTRITAITSTQKTMLHSEKFLSTLVQVKRIV